MTQTLGHFVDSFFKVYGLSKTHSLDRHEYIHAMTGLGIGGADELRVDAVSYGILNVSVEYARQQLDETYSYFKTKYYKGNGALNAPAGSYETEKFQMAFQHMTPLTDPELEAFHNLGRYLGRVLKSMTGRNFYRVPCAEYAALNFEDVDVSWRAMEIKEKFQSAVNRRVERVARNILEQNALRITGKSLIPEQHESWVARVRKDALNAG